MLPEVTRFYRQTTSTQHKKAFKVCVEWVDIGNYSTAALLILHNQERLKAICWSIAPSHHSEDTGRTLISPSAQFRRQQSLQLSHLKNKHLKNKQAGSHLQTMIPLPPSSTMSDRHPLLPALVKSPSIHFKHTYTESARLSSPSLLGTENINLKGLHLLCKSPASIFAEKMLPSSAGPLVETLSNKSKSCALRLPYWIQQRTKPGCGGLGPLLLQLHPDP